MRTPLMPLPHTHVMRPELPPVPQRMQSLRIDARGYPVPWFVAIVNGEPEFRVMDGRKLEEAVRRDKCWVCGKFLERKYAFVMGPMCVVNLNNAEPPCHPECAEYSAINCPFLSKPQMRRRENDLPEGTIEGAGFAIKRNPGCVAVYITKNHEIHQCPNGFLFTPGPAEEVRWFACGRKATRAEVMESIESGLPILMDMAEKQGTDAVNHLMACRQVAELLLPKE